MVCFDCAWPNFNAVLKAIHLCFFDLRLPISLTYRKKKVAFTCIWFPLRDSNIIFRRSEV